MGTDKPAGRPGYHASHPGRIIRRNLDALGMTIEAFAEHIGVAADRALDHFRSERGKA